MRCAALLLQAGVLQALVMPRQPPIKTALRAAPDMEDLTRRVFCSRELNMANIEAVGFDMDYTLAQYNEAFDMLAFEGAKDKLIDMGYPEEARSRRPAVLRRLHAIGACRLQERRSWVVSFSSLRPFGPSRDRDAPRRRSVPLSSTLCNILVDSSLTSEEATS